MWVKKPLGAANLTSSIANKISLVIYIHKNSPFNDRPIQITKTILNRSHQIVSVDPQVLSRSALYIFRSFYSYSIRIAHSN